MKSNTIMIDHVAMYVTDIEATKEFFIQYFNAKAYDIYCNMTTGFRSYFLSFGDSATRLEIMNRPELNEIIKHRFNSGFNHIAISVGGKDKVDSITRQLRDAGYEVISGPRTTGDGYYESCILDAEDNLIEITE